MSASRTYRNIALIGFMGSGKSSVGQMVAAQLRFKYVDTDVWIEGRARKPITRIFAEEGEAVFREWERQVVAELARLDRAVIATGGGLGANAQHVESLKQHALVVCLWVTPEVIWSRVREQSHRPLLQCADPMGKIRELLAEREPVYRQADVLINSGLRSIREAAHQVIYQFQQARREASKEA